MEIKFLLFKEALKNIIVSFLNFLFMKPEDCAKIILIYAILPQYWAVWKNRFDTWSCGEVGDIYEDGTPKTAARHVGTLDEILKKISNL